MRLFYCLQGEASIKILTRRRPPLDAQGKLALSLLRRSQYRYVYHFLLDGGWSHCHLSDLEWSCGASLGFDGHFLYMKKKHNNFIM